MGAPIQIKVYPHKLSLWNAGELPDKWTLDDLLGEHSSRPFNPDIANAFFRAGEIEAWGRGIRLIFEACQAAGSPDPTFAYQGSDMRLEFRYPETMVAEMDVGTTPKTTQETTPKIPETTQEETGTTQEGLGERAETPVKTPVKTPDAIVTLLRADPDLTLAEVAREIGKSLRAVERATAKLTAAGRLRRVGSRKEGHWEVLS